MERVRKLERDTSTYDRSERRQPKQLRVKSTSATDASITEKVMEELLGVHNRLDAIEGSTKLQEPMQPVKGASNF